MSHCLNPDCGRSQNPDQANFCQHCGRPLVLKARYLATELLGQGGFGRTFRALDRHPPQHPHCVIKQFFPALQGQAHSPKALDLFHQEALRLETLGHHPQVPALIDHFEEAGYLYIIQTLIDGQTLAQQLEADGPFTEAQIRTLLEELLPVLSFIHQAQVIHRDIKPANIIYPDAAGPAVIVDFGAAKFATATRLAQTGTVIGSAAYVAPEQALGKAVFASDLYSLGVTCIHLLTGIHPFDLYSVSEDAWVWHQYLPTSISPELTKVLDRMLQRGLRQRYQTAQQVLEDLNQPPPRISRGRRRSVQSPKTRISMAKTSWHCVHTLIQPRTVVNALTVSPSGRAIATGGSDNAIALWDLATGKQLFSFSGQTFGLGSGHRGPVQALCFGLSGSTLFSASEDGTVKLWDLVQQTLIQTLPKTGWLRTTVALNPQRQLLASGSEDGTIDVWDLATGAAPTTLTYHRDRVAALRFSPDGTYLVSGGYDKTIRLWNCAAQQLHLTLRDHGDRVSAIAISPTATILASGSWDHTVKLWGLADGNLYQTLNLHTDWVSAIAISPDSKTLATASTDSTIQLVDLTTGQVITTLHHDWGVTALTFSADHQTLISSSADGTIKIWRMGEE